MADSDTTRSAQLDAQEIVRETNAIAREVLASLIHSWLDIPHCKAPDALEVQHDRD